MVTEAGKTPALRELACLWGGGYCTYNTVWGSHKYHTHPAGCVSGEELDLKCAEIKEARHLLVWGVGKGYELYEQMKCKWASWREMLSISLLSKTGEKGTET